MKGGWVVASVLASLASAARADEPPLMPPSMTPLTPVPVETDEMPPLSNGRVAGEFALGAVAGVGLGVAGGFLGYSIETAQCDGDFLCGIGGMVIGGSVGYLIGVPLGVYYVGAMDDQTGSLGMTVGGTAVGAAAGFVVLLGAAAVETDEAAAVVVVGALACPLIGAVVGFNKSRRYKAGHAPRLTVVPTANVTSERSTFGVAGSF